MTYRPGYSDFFHDFRGHECVIVYSKRDPGDWWIAPIDEDGGEGESFTDLTEQEEQTLGELIGQNQYDGADE